MVLQQWKEDQDLFVGTRASDYVMQCLKTNKCVSVVGPRGVGKSCLVHHVALKMKKKGFHIISVFTPDDITWTFKLNKNKKMLFVVEDVCGRYTIQTEMLDKWKNEMTDLTKILDECSSSRSRLILTCRLKIFEDQQFEDPKLQLFKTCYCNLADTQFALTDSEKKELAKKYSLPNVEVEKHKDTDCFPLLCSLYKHFNVLEVKFLD